MKELVILTIIMIIGISVHASKDNSGVVLVKSADKSIQLLYAGFEHTKTSLIIRDDEGITLYAVTKKSPDDLPTRFSFVTLKDSKLIIVVENELKITETVLAISDGLAVPTGVETITYKPRFEQKDDKLYLNVFNPSQEDVLISIQDNLGYELIETSTDKNVFVQKVYDFSSLREDANVCVRVGKRAYYEPIEN